MYLIKKNSEITKYCLDICFEKVVDDLLMISITNKVRYEGILSYWRLVNIYGIPPLEVGVDCKNGAIVSIVFCIDKSFIHRQAVINVSKTEGNLSVDTSNFTKTNDYVDINQAYEVDIQEDKLICLFSGTCEIKQCYQTERIEFYLDSLDQFVGFAICGLTEAEMKDLNSI